MRMQWQVPSHAQDFWAPSTFCGRQSLDLVSLLPGDAHSSLGLTSLCIISLALGRGTKRVRKTLL